MKLPNMILRMSFVIVLFAAGSGATLAAPADSAPLPEDIIQRVVTDRVKLGGNPLTDQLSQHLDEVSELANQVEAEDKKTKSPSEEEEALNTKRMVIRSKLHEFAELRKEIKAYFAETRGKLAQQGLNGKAAVLDATLQAVEQRFDRITNALDSVHNSKQKNGRGLALGKLKAELKELHGKVKEQADLANQQPVPTFTQQEPPASRELPASPTTPQYFASPYTPGNMYAFLGNNLLAVAPDPTPTEAASCSYTAADLAETSDVSLTPEIRALAEKLNYSPVQIYQYVSNEIKFEPYWGSLKGTMGTLYSKAGGPTDQASLLIALLRASNIPTRYVRGTIQITDLRGPRWIGAKTYDAAIAMVGQGLNPTYGKVVSGAGATVGMQIAHVWVEACVPYGNYRGNAIDKSGHRWIPLDPSFKDKTYQAGIATNVAFDYTTYMARRTNTLPHEKYEEQVSASIKALPPNYSNNTLSDVGYLGTLLPRQVDVLPATLPYTVVQFTSWGTGLTAEVAALPDAHRYKLTITSANSAGTALAPAVTLDLPTTVLKRTTLSFKGLTTTDQSALDTWKANPDLLAALPCTINVVPVIKAEGVDQSVGTTAVGFCTTQNRLTMDLRLNERSSPLIKTITFNNINAANYHALQGYAFQASDRLLRERAAKLLASVRNTPSPNTNLEETEGEYLHLVGLKYMRYITDSAKRIGELDGGSGESGNHLGLTATQMKVKYLFDLPFAITRQGFLIDVPGGQSRTVDLSTGALVWKTFQLSGYSSSAFEAYIWQENARMDAVSTVRGLQFAKEMGIAILTITSANQATEIPKLTSNTNTTLNYPASYVASVQSYINAGYTVTAPRSLIQYNNWRGAVWVAEKNDTVAKTMSGAYIINGSYAGGFTTSDPTNMPSLYSFADPVTNNFSSGIDFGTTSYSTFAGDPVNMVSGNMYHTERDLAIKGRGGLPVVFERSYNSRDAKDGPLGFGWTHSFNHSLTFNDHNTNGVTDSADTDGITSSVTWTDGTGSKKFILVAGSTAGVAVGSVFVPPKGYFFNTARNADGTYSIREKNGLTYIFGNIAGTVAQKAKLSKIVDRNGNALTLTYTGNNLTTVTDSLSRSLTLTYDVNNRLIEVKDWTNRRQQYVYDAAGNLVTYKNPLAVAGAQPPVSYSYYSDTLLNHVMKSYTLPRGNGMTFEYYINGRVFKHYTTLGETTSFTYNDFRREAIGVNERGYTRTFYFDANGNPVKIVEENGAERTYTYDSVNVMNRLSKLSPPGYLTQYAYDTNGNVTRITQPSGATVEYSYFNTYNQPGKIKDARGNYTLVKYDAKGNPLQTVRLKAGIGATLDPTTYTPVATDLLAWTLNSYDSFGNVLTGKQVRDFTAQAGPTLEYSYNDTVNLVQGLNPVGITRRGDKNGDGLIDATEFDSASLSYDPLGRVKTGLNEDWYPTQFVYDDVDRVIKGTDTAGQLRDYQYDPNGNPSNTGLTVPVAGVPTLVDQASASYDLSDRTLTGANAGGFTTAYQYDTAGNITKITNPDSYTLAFEYDPNNHITKAYDQQGNAVSRTLDLDGKPRSITDPNGNSINYTYYGPERDGRLKQQINALGRITQFDYDTNGNVVSVTDPLGRVTLTTYDELNRPTRIVGPQYTDALLGTIRPVTRYSYNNLGQRTKVEAGRTDATGTNPASDVLTPQMTYSYDDFGRLLKDTDPLSRSRQYAYDIFSNVTRVTDAKGQVTTYTWGYGHQLLTQSSAAGTVSYTRNPLGLATQVQGPNVTYRYSYDSAHRLKTLNDSRGNKTLQYRYSPGSLLTRLTDGEGVATDYLYDSVGRLTGIGAGTQLIGFTYDAAGRLTQKTLPSGVSTRYTYNPDNTLSQVQNRSTSASVVTQHDYSYDAAGNRLTHTEQIGATLTKYQYLYNALDRLSEVRNNAVVPSTLIEGYSYDTLGNRSQKTDGVNTTAYVYDTANQLKEIRQGSPTGALLASLSYDPNGNLLTKSEGATLTSLSYDALNRLSQVSKTGQANQSYQCDDQGRRIQKTVGATSTNYLYNGSDIQAEYSGWTSPLARYTHGPGTDNPLIRSTATANQYYHQDGLGSVIALTNATGGSDGTARFDAWGNKLASTGAIPQYGYTGTEQRGQVHCMTI
ncbi:MAG: type IV secretion protein Rhs [Gammaproteobacteria bacterium]|nr:type IV secretion protein Rhs [Gammaproteobacteria bacterium]